MGSEQVSAKLVGNFAGRGRGREKGAAGSGWPALGFELLQLATPTLPLLLLLLLAGLTHSAVPPICCHCM